MVGGGRGTGFLSPGLRERVGVGVQNAVNHLGSSHHQADFGAFEGDVSHASKPTYEDI